MTEIREIVTRAVLSKGRKIIKITENIPDTTDAYSVLGCWIINHQFYTTLKGKEVELEGSFENNIWYTADNNTKTEVARKITEYNTVIRVRDVASDAMSENCDVIARILQQPTCTNAVICDDGIKIDICLEILVEVIGETKVVVNILNCPNPNMDVDDFENDINEDFLNEG